MPALDTTAVSTRVMHHLNKHTMNEPDSDAHGDIPVCPLPSVFSSRYGPTYSSSLCEWDILPPWPSLLPFRSLNNHHDVRH